MADKQSKSSLPDFNEITSIAGKLFGDLKKSVGEIINDYKAKREPNTEEKETSKEEEPTVKKTAAPKNNAPPSK